MARPSQTHMLRNDMHTLFALNQFDGLAGGTLVPLEVAEYLRSLGSDCLIVANHISDPLLSEARNAGIEVTDDPQTVNAFDFDLVWAQGHTVPLLRFAAGKSERTRFVFSHLSTQLGFETPGLVFEPLLADSVLANSPETEAHLLALGVPSDKLKIFPNPAPAAFWMSRRSPKQLRTVRLISNHPPEEAVEALKILESHGIRTRWIGNKGQYQVRVTPDLINRSSAILSIGKSVQYAIAGGIPAYVYDRFAGPGYLNADNFERAAWANFSGRCCRRTISANEIASEIVDGFAAASAFTAGLSEDRLGSYRLEPHVDWALSLDAPSNAERLALLQKNEPMLRRERALALSLREHFRGHKSHNAIVKMLRNRIDRYRRTRKGSAS